jgi:hypothetical protein
LPGLCSFICALSVGGLVSFWVRLGYISLGQVPNVFLVNYQAACSHDLQ